MKWIENLFDRLRPNFEGKDARWASLYPLFEAAESFLFLSAKKTTGPPHARDAVETKRYMSTVIVALLPPYLFGLLLFGPRLLLMTAVSYTLGGIVESLFAIFRKEEINEGFLVTGLIFPMVLPPGTPLWIVGMGIVFGVFFGKEVFGGTGHNVFNPALVGRCFVTLSWPARLAQAYYQPGAWLDSLKTNGPWALWNPGPDAISSATPLAEVNEILQATGSSPTDLQTLWTYYTGVTSGCTGETCAVLILLCGAFLCWTRVANWRTPFSILVTYTVLAAIFSHPKLWGDVFAAPWVGLGTGSLLFGAFYMATDPVSSPVSLSGKWIYGGCIGLLVLLFRGMGAVPEGVTYAILMMNMFAPLIDRQIMQASVPKPLPSEEPSDE